MKRFVFRLERLLRWRTIEKERQEGRLQALFAERARHAAARIALDASGRSAEESVLRPDVFNEERQALGHYRRFVAAEQLRMRRLHAELESRIEVQRGLLVEAERKLEGLKHMREDMQTAWRGQMEKEQGDLVDELVVARWGRTP